MADQPTRHIRFSEMLDSALSRREVLKRAMAIGVATPAIAGLLAACDDGDDEEAVADTDDQAEPAVEDPDDGEEPDAVEESDEEDDSGDAVVEETSGRHGGSIVIAQPNDFVNMFPTFSTGPTPAYCYDTIVQLSFDGDVWEVAPMLAESWEFEEDSVTFHLREDVEFHDGTPFNAEALQWNIDLKRNHPQSIARPNLLSIDEENPADVIDDYTLQVNLSEPDGALLSHLAQHLDTTGIESPTAYERIEAEEDEEAGSIIFREAVGTGPYVLEEWVTSSHITVRRNENYWDTDSDGNQLPYLDEIRANWVSDDSVRLLEMRSGAADVTSFIRGRDVSSVQDDPELQYIEDPASAGTIHRFFFNGVRGPFSDDPHLRKAVQYAIDREAMAETVGGGLGEPARLDVAPGTPGYDEERVPYYWYDLDRAREHREQSNAPAGIDIRLVVIAREVDEQQAQMVQQFLQEIDINLVIELVERAAWGDQVRRASDFDMATQRGDLTPDRAGGWALHWSLDDAAAYSRGNEPEIYEYLQYARSIMDDEERHEAYIELQTMMYEAAWWGVYWVQPTNFLLSSRVQGFPTQWSARGYGATHIWVEEN